jgi:hypothetical protein
MKEFTMNNTQAPTTDNSTKAWDHVNPCTEVDWCTGHQVSDMEIGLDAHMSEPINLHTIRFAHADGRMVEAPLRVCKTQDRATGALTFDAALRIEDDMSVRSLEGLGLQLADAGAALQRWAQEQIGSES